MRILLAIPLLVLGACGVSNDAQNDEVVIQYDENEMEQVASDMGNAAENAGDALGNAARDAAATIENTDVDVSTDGDASENSQ